MLDDERAYVGERCLLRRLCVLQECASRLHGERSIARAECAEIERAELLGEPALRCVLVELPGRQRVRRHAGRKRDAVTVGIQQLARDDALQLTDEIACRDVAQSQLPSGEIEPGDTDALPRRIERDQQRIAPRIEQSRVGKRSRRDNASDLALDRSLRGRRIADLLADRDRFAETEELGEILLDCVMRDARHGDRRSRRRAARGERDVEH
ncbi:MAG TPA: hypothetical protein VFF43_00470, partial [Caldimonas sp.]|nr:hypothetical protein [Caldimonas sp.]